MVAYFSASGKTKRMAEKLAQSSNLDLYEIKPEVKYSRADLNWSNKNSRSSIEMNDRNSRPKLADQDIDFSDYDTISF